MIFLHVFRFRIDHGYFLNSMMFIFLGESFSLRCVSIGGLFKQEYSF
nr:MAG TPA: hypothetical protein [Caudoviricetes sp.]